MTEEREKAMLYIIAFFRNKMAAVNHHNVKKAKELINIHDINTYELIEKYVDLVLKTS